MRPMDRSAERLRAKLQWEAACERLAFALSPPPAAAGQAPPDLGFALKLVQEALDALRAAYAAD
jgi:hypothetical protein